MGPRQIQFMLTMRDQASRVIRTFGQTMSSAANQARQMASSLSTLGNAADQAERKARRASNGFGQLRGMLAALGGAAVALQGLNIVAEFGDMMSTVAAVSGATAEQFQLLRYEAELLGIRTRFTARQAAEGMVELARGGFSAGQTLAAILPTLDLAAAGAIDLATGARIMIAALSSFQMPATESARVADLLAYVANKSATDVTDLGEAFKYVGSTAAAFGVNIVEAGAALAALADRGIRGSLAGTGLRRVITILNKDTPRWRATLSQLGLTMDDVNTRTHGLVEVLRRLKDAGLQNNPSRILDIFGDRGGPTLINLLGNFGKIERMMEAMNPRPVDQAARAMELLDQHAHTAQESVRGVFNELLDRNSDTFRRALEQGNAILGTLPDNASLGARLASFIDFSPEQLRNVFGPATESIQYMLDHFEEIGPSLTAFESNIDGTSRAVAFMMDNNLGGALRRLNASWEGFWIALGQDQSGVMRNAIEEIALAMRQLVARTAFEKNSIGEDIRLQVGIRMGLTPEQITAMRQGTPAARELDRAVAQVEQRVKLLSAAMAGLRAVIVGGAVVALTMLAGAILSNPIGWLAIAVGVAAGALDYFKDKTIEVGGQQVVFGDLVAAAWEKVTTYLADFFERFKRDAQVSAQMFAPWLNGLIRGTLKLGLAFDDMGRRAAAAWQWATGNGGGRTLTETIAQVDRETRARMARIDGTDYAGQFAGGVQEWFQDNAAQLVPRAQELGEQRRQREAALARERARSLAAATIPTDRRDASGEEMGDTELDPLGSRGGRDRVGRFREQAMQRIAALTLSREAQDRMNYATQLGLTLTMEEARTGQLAAGASEARARAFQMVTDAITAENAAREQARVRELGIDAEVSRARAAMVNLSAREQAIENAILDERVRIARENNYETLQMVQLSPAMIAAIRAAAEAQDDLNTRTRGVMASIRASWDEWKRKVQDVGGQVGDVMTSVLDDFAGAMTDFLMGQEVDWNEFARSVIAAIAKIIIQLLILKAVQATMSAFGFADGGTFGATGFAKGGMFGNVQKFASGGTFTNSVITAPTLFKFGQGGKIGLMGEAGPEAVMPLTRMRNGKLGVAAAQMGGGGQTAVFSPSFNIKVEASGDKDVDEMLVGKLGKLIDGLLTKKMQEFQQSQIRNAHRMERFGAAGAMS